LFSPFVFIFPSVPIFVFYLYTFPYIINKPPGNNAIDRNALLNDVYQTATGLKTSSKYQEEPAITEESRSSLGDSREEGVLGVPGDGMEWHSDGEEGEFTVLLALDDIPHEVGSLGFIPGSYRQFIPGTGHGNVSPVIFQYFDLLSYFLSFFGVKILNIM
jgi:hypothetical protein